MICEDSGVPAHVRRAAWAVALACAAAGQAHASGGMVLADSVEHAAPPMTQLSSTSGTLYLELVVNALSSGQVAQVRYHDGAYFVRASDLNKVSVRTGNVDGTQWVDPAKIKGVQIAYDSGEQRLLLAVPPDWLPEQHIGGARLFDRTPAVESRGLLFNYDVYSAFPTQGSGYTSLWTEERMLDRWGTLSNTGVYRDGYGAASAGAPGNKRYLRYDTTWTYSDQDRMVTYTAGDLVTGALSWSSPVRIGGISIARDFSVRPDIVTYPLPQFAGQAAVPTAVDLFINGSKASTNQVNPGPFTMNNVPFINGAGEATVVTTNALGQQVATTIPFYVANTLLQKGLTNYSFSAGAIRNNYGLDSFSYGKPAASASLRYGLTDRLTLEAHAEGGEQLEQGGVGADLGVGRLGAVSASAANSRLGSASGQQYSVGYSYTSQHFSIAAQRTQRSSGYRDLSVYDVPINVNYQLERTITQATGALNLGSLWGTMGVGYFDVLAADNSHTRIANLSYTRPLFGRAMLYAALNKTLGGQLAAQVQVILPLDTHGTVTALAQHGASGWTEGAQYNRSVPSDGGIGADLVYLGGASQYQQADVTWRNRYTQIAGGAYGSGVAGAGYTRWAELQGSVVAMDGAVMPANRVTDAFVMVSTQGRADVPVRYENQLIGTTDSHGHLLVTTVPSYYAAKYEIDPLNLASNEQAPQLEQHIAVRRNAGALVTFPIQKIVAARITLVNAAGEPIKVGAEVVDDESAQHAIVGFSGDTYLEGLSAENHLTVTEMGGQACHVTFKMDLDADQIGHVGPLTCTQ